MNAFDRITNNIYNQIKGTGLAYLSLENIKFIIEDRNDIIEEFDTGWINWDLLEKKNKAGNEEREFRKEMYDLVKSNALEEDIVLSDDDLDKIFKIEMEIVGNKKINYYDTSYFSFDSDKEIPFEEMEFKKKYVFNKWTDWQKTIDNAEEDFYDEFDLFPNNLYANKHSHSQINFIVNNVPGLKDHTWIIDNETKMIIPANPDEEVIIGNYENQYCKLRFYFDDSLNDKDFILEYIDNPDDDYGDEDDDDGDDDDVNVPTPVDIIESVK